MKNNISFFPSHLQQSQKYPFFFIFKGVWILPTGCFLSAITKIVGNTQLSLQSRHRTCVIVWSWLSQGRDKSKHGSKLASNLERIKAALQWNGVTLSSRWDTVVSLRWECQQLWAFFGDRVDSFIQFHVEYYWLLMKFSGSREQKNVSFQLPVLLTNTSNELMWASGYCGTNIYFKKKKRNVTTVEKCVFFTEVWVWPVISQVSSSWLQCILMYQDRANLWFQTVKRALLTSPCVVFINLTLSIWMDDRRLIGVKVWKNKAELFHVAKPLVAGSHWS